MPKSKKPRKSYNPKAVRIDNLGYTLKGLPLVSSLQGHVQNLKLVTHSALVELSEGRGLEEHLNNLLHTSNMVEALWRLDFAKDYEEIVRKGKETILSCAKRATESGNYSISKAETEALGNLLELHDALMEVTTVADVRKAESLISKILRSGGAVAVPSLKAKQSNLEA